MNEDLSDVINKINDMINNNEIPDNIKNIMNSFSNNDNNEKNSNSNIDPEMLLKISQIMNKMKSNQSSPRANLLRSLKPYLNSDRQKKVDQYIQLFNIENVIDLMNNGGGKNDL